ncbi:hypothetical protein NFC81_10070 [Salinispirillum sp. LH 10-3-1]|uniref:DUF4249 family protein n=1 Tax=Salinispirillum sp. LH 10-3-1 TaxID=2952525 RepID=A0AB38YCI2_9GAMM
MTNNAVLSPRPLILLTLSSILLVGCGTVPVDRVQPERLTVNVEYERQPDQVEVDVWMRAGFWQRRVRTEDSILALQASNGDIVHLQATSERGRYSASANASNGPYHLQLADFSPLALPMGPPIILQDPNAHREETFSLNDSLLFTFDNPTDKTLQWELTANCSNETFTVRRTLSPDASTLMLPMQTAKQQLDRASQARLLGTIPISVTLYEAYDVAHQPPFRIRKARGQDSIDVFLTTPSFGVSVSGSVGLQVSSNAFVGLGASTAPTKRCL